MARSIFSPKPEKQPDYKQALQETESSILKRLNSFIDETTNKWKSTNDWIKKTGDQVNELLKRTFDLQRKVEGQMIDVENTAKKQFYDYDVKMQKFENRLEGKYATVDEFDKIGGQIVSAVKKVDKKINKNEVRIESVRSEIPKNTVKNQVFEEIVSELRTNLEKLANAIPKNVASNDLVSDIRKELFAKFDGYPTTDALKSVKNQVDSNIRKVAQASANTTKESLETRKQFDKLAATVTDIRNDYLPQSMVPKLRQETTQVTLQLTDLINEVENKIPKDYVKTNEVDVLREFQKDIVNQFEEHKTSTNKSVSTTMANIESIMTRTSNVVGEEIEAFKKTLAETTMGEDSNFMKTIIRDIADEEIRQMRNQSELFQQNVKNNIIEMKNQNRNLANKVTELQKSFDKFLALATGK